MKFNSKLKSAITVAAIALTLSGSSYARTIHQDTIVNKRIWRTISVGITLYTGVWNHGKCTWTGEYPLTNIKIKPKKSIQFLLNDTPVLKNLSCGELRFVSNYKQQKSDRFKVILDGSGNPEGSAPDHVTVTFGEK